MMANAMTEMSEEEYGMLEQLAILAGEDAGRGNENVTSADIAIPYIGILQKMSPQCDETDPEFLPNAKPGMFFQNVNMIMWDTAAEGPLPIVPCAFDRKIIEWIPREAGGGLVAVHDVNTPLMREATPNDKKVPTLANGHNLIDTSTHYVLYLSPITHEFEPAVISMKSTAQKKSRLWNSLISQQVIPGTKRPAPRWLYKWDFTTGIETKNDKRWYNYEFGRGELVDVETYNKARKLNEGFRAGLITPPDPSGVSRVDDEIPF